MIALKKIYVKDYRIAVTNREKTFYYCHVKTCCIILANTYVSITANVGNTN